MLGRNITWVYIELYLCESQCGPLRSTKAMAQREIHRYAIPENFAQSPCRSTSHVKCGVSDAGRGVEPGHILLVERNRSWRRGVAPCTAAPAIKVAAPAQLLRQHVSGERGRARLAKRRAAVLVVGATRGTRGDARYQAGNETDSKKPFTTSSARADAHGIRSLAQQWLPVLAAQLHSSVLLFAIIYNALDACELAAGEGQISARKVGEESNACQTIAACPVRPRIRASPATAIPTTEDQSTASAWDSSATSKWLARPQLAPLSLRVSLPDGRGRRVLLRWAQWLLAPRYASFNPDNEWTGARSRPLLHGPWSLMYRSSSPGIRGL
ncbi:hypothetical protein BKA63DRAFT_144248 [Paraphoma chrysanthemicola]|nr:hypothetical protein BKA63DRAFT_144248 [Paraphoma chrysanthemicola]